MTKDTLYRFLFEEMGVRGALVYLDDALKAILELQSLYTTQRKILGESLACVSLLATNLRVNTIVRLQLQNLRADKMVLAQCDYNYCLRGLVQWLTAPPVAEAITDLAGGNVIISIEDIKNGPLYQGITQLTEDNLALVMEHYFNQSEQLPSLFHFAYHKGRAAGLMLQMLPADTATDLEQSHQWEHLLHLTRTLTDEELLKLPPEDLLQRLYHEEAIRLFDPERLSFLCSCSIQRMEEVLLSLGREEVNGILADMQFVEMGCKFCNKTYRFDSVDIEKLFTQNDGTSPAENNVH